MDCNADAQKELGHRIEAAGWRQCSLFRPSPESANELPDYLRFNPETEWLVICTQSCSVCSPNFQTEPLIEVVVGTPLPRYKSTHGSAKGRSVRELHLPVQGLEGATGVSLQIGRRAFLPREYLPRCERNAAQIPSESLKDFQGWMARYYSRIALPEALVRRIRAPGGIKETVKATLTEVLNGVPLHTQVHAFFIRWEPNAEQPASEPYKLSLVVACETEDAEERLLRTLPPLASGIDEKPVTNGIIMEEPTVKRLEDVTMANIRHHSRFTEWDELSELGESAEALRAT